MGFAHFIARRILGDSERQDRLSRPIVLIAILGIVIGMAVMILTVGISTGFQGEVRAKVTGAGAHIEILPLAQGDGNTSARVRTAQPFYPWLDTVAGVDHIQVFALQPGIVETKDDIQGVVAKGVGADHDWEFLRAHLVAGAVLSVGDSVRSEVLISRWLSQRLRRSLGDDLTVYLIKGREDIRPRKYRIKGIYETGLEKVDHQLIYMDIAHIQRFAQWGVQAEIRVDGEAAGPGITVEGLGFGGDGRYSYDWPGTPLRGKGPHTLCVAGDTTLMMVLSDNGGTLPDTAWLHIRPSHAGREGRCLSYADAHIGRRTSGGSYKAYCGGFEVILKEGVDLTAMDDLIYREYLGVGLRTVTARQKFPEIFAWLELLDTNVVVVIVLMVLVAIINMTSALLIIILERTNMIGVLKALGSTNGTIRRIFLIDAAYIMGIGILAGDVLGIGLALLQQHFGLVRLPIESYYVNVVPVDLSIWPIAALNIGVLAVCVLALVVPSMYVSRIAPAKAIRFE
ncbi:MAG: ABC transporter permease [Flavobacteriales bacterium]|nr:ABC transporter permease [Flavobacteriales bacterium]MEB2342583.1 ABC transporter permease [Flavobacteriia bacterium]